MADTASKPAPAALSVTRDMTVMEIVTLVPQAADIMAEYGLHCFHCSIGGVESLADGCAMHGIDDEMLGSLLEDLNTALAEGPARPRDITLTLPAARAIGEIAESQGKKGEILEVVVDEQGGFCMEFREEPSAEHTVFFHPEEPAVRIAALPLTLARIGGSTIDFREGRFKLDLPEDAHASCGCAESGSCTCGHADSLKR